MPWTALPYAAILHKLSTHACSAPSFRRSSDLWWRFIDRFEAATVLAQQKATAHRSLEASLVLVPATITFWMRPVTRPIGATVVVTSLALRHLVF